MTTARLRALLCTGLALAIGVLALPLTASANLPKKPACSAVTAKQLKSAFGYSFSHPTAKAHQTKTMQRLVCTYTSDQGDLSIEYDTLLSNKAARARYAAVQKALIREANNTPVDIPTQLLPLLPVGGLGDTALRSTDGTVVAFVDGVDCVTIENGFAEIDRRMTRKMVAFAHYVDGHA